MISFAAASTLICGTTILVALWHDAPSLVIMVALMMYASCPDANSFRLQRELREVMIHHYFGNQKRYCRNEPSWDERIFCDAIVATKLPFFQCCHVPMGLCHVVLVVYTDRGDGNKSCSLPFLGAFDRFWCLCGI